MDPKKQRRQRLLVKRRQGRFDFMYVCVCVEGVGVCVSVKYIKSNFALYSILLPIVTIA